MAATASSEPPLLPLIISYNRLKVIKFAQQMSYDKFSTRTVHVESNNFRPPGKYEPKYFLRLKPSIDDYSTKSVHLQFNLTSTSKKNVRIEGTTCVLDRDGTKLFPYPFDSTLSQGGSYNIFVKARSELLNTTNGLLPDDKLTFYCEFTFNVESNEDRIASVADQLMEKSDECSRINDDLGRLLADDKLTDVQIVVGKKRKMDEKEKEFRAQKREKNEIEEKEFHAHKCILAARSPVFSAMFEHDTKEKQQNRVEITDVQPDVFREVLRYIYTGKIGSLDKLGAELLVVADKYQLDSLKALCEETLCDQLSPKIAKDLIVLAEKHTADKLKQSALEYFRKNTQECIEALFDANKTEVLLKAFGDIVSGSSDKQDGSSSSKD